MYFLLVVFSDTEQARVAWERYEKREKSIISGMISRDDLILQLYLNFAHIHSDYVLFLVRVKTSLFFSTNIWNEMRDTSTLLSFKLRKIEISFFRLLCS